MPSREPPATGTPESAPPPDAPVASPAEADAPTRGRRRRKRAGRFRRWVVRPLVWSLALLAIVLLVVQILLDAPWTRERARRLIATRLTELLQRPVEIDEIEFEVLPLSVVVRGFTIAGPSPGDPPFVHVPWASIEADLDALQQRRLHLQEVRVDRPSVVLEFFPDGSNNYPKRRRDGPRRRGPRTFEVWIDRIEIDDGEFGLDQDRIRLSIASDDARVRFRGLGDLRVGGQLVSQQVVLRLPDARPITLAFSADAVVEAEHLEVTGSRITGPGVAVNADGTCDWTIGDRLDRKCLFQARGVGQGAVLDDLGYFRDLAGTFEFNGSFAWRPGTSGWRSRVRADRLVAWGRPIEDLDGSLVADRYGVRGVLDRARYADGSITGEVIYEQLEEGQPLTVDLDFEDLVFDTLLADQGIPSRGYASRADGKLLYRFARGQPEHGDGRAEVALGIDPGRYGVPFVSKALPLRIEAGVVRAESVSARSDRQSVLASGWYDLARDRGAFDYEIASADLPQLTPLLPLTDLDPVPLWLPTGGQGSLTGKLFLEPGAASTDLRLELDKVQTPSGRFASVDGDLQLDATAVASMRLVLGDGDEALLLEGRMPYAPTDDDPTELVFDAFRWPLDVVRPWLDFDLPIEGSISGRLHLTVGADASSGVLAASVAPAALVWTPGSEPWLSDLREVSGRLDWDRDRVRFQHLEIRAASGTAVGEGVYDWTSGEVDLGLRSAALEISRPPLSTFLPRQDLRGEVSVEARIAGPLERPRIDLEVAAEALAVGDKVLESRPSRLTLSSEDGTWQVEGRLLDMVTVHGGGLLDRRRADLSVELDGSDLAGLIDLLFENPPADVGGTFRGTLQVAGSPPEVALTLESLRMETGGRVLENLEPVAVQVTPERLLLDSFYLGERATGSEFFLTGEMDWGAGRDPRSAELDLFLQSSMAASWLELVDFGLDLDGTFDLLARIRGSMEHLEIDGQGELHDGRLTMGSFPYPIDEIDGVVSIYPGSVVLDRLTGRFAGGRIELEGVAALAAYELVSYRLRARGEGLRMLYPEGWTVHGDTELTLRSTDDGHLVDGRAQLDQLEYRDDVRFDFAELMRGFLRRQRLEVEPADSLLSAIELNVDVEAPAALRVRNNLADLTGSADLTLRGDLAQPLLYGAIDVDPGGTVVYNSTEFEVERGRVDFVNPFRFDPEVDLVLSTRVRDFDISLDLSGTFERFETRFSSEPPLPDLEVFRLLATGDVTPQTTVLEPRLADTRIADRREAESTSAATFLYGQAAAVIGERFNTLFGFDKFRIDPLTGSGDNLSKTRLTVGKRVSKDFFVTYSLDPSSTEEPRWQVEWQVSPGFVLVLTQNGDSTYSADARWESSF